jgi:hypothetical protein
MAKETKTKKPSSLKELQGNLQQVLEELKALEATNPYLVDAQAFLQQSIVMLEKHIVTEVG